MSDVIVVGGGIIGLLTAHELRAAGAKVTILEQGKVGQESSWAGGGILSPLYPWRYPDAVNRLASWGQQRYQKLADSLLESTGIDPEWRKSGLLMPGVEQGEVHDAMTWAERHAVSLERLSAEEASKVEPAIRLNMEALWLPQVAQLRNPRLLQALYALLIKRGVEILEDTPVTGLKSQNGVIEGVYSGTRLHAAANIVFATGAWSGEVAALCGLNLPVEPVKGQMLLYKAKPDLLHRIVLYNGHYLIPRKDGHILIGSTMEKTGFDKSTTHDAAMELHHVIKEVLPQLEHYPQVRHWAGLRPGSPDGVPMIGPVPGVKGLFLNTGHFRNGVVMGYASARLLSCLVQGQTPNLEPDEFLPENFIL